MKRFQIPFLFLALLLIISSCKKNTTEIEKKDRELLNSRVTKVSNIVDPNDPNLNATWNWWTYQSHRMYYSPNGSITNIQTLDKFLPFYTQGNILNTGPELDIYPEDGWVLAFKDFGTPTRPIDFPFFALYNKYRGTFRVMLYNAQQTQSSYLKGELSFVNPSYAGALMTLNAEGNQAFIDSYDRSVKDHQITTVNQFADWIVFDFNLAGYDPNYSPNAGLKLQIHRVDETSMTLNSTAFTLNEVVKKSTPGGQGSSFANAINNGYNIFDSVNDLKGVLDEKVKDSSTGFLHNILNSSYVQAVPIIGKALGVIRAFIGGTTKPAPRQPMKFEGTLNFTGLATLGNTLYSRTFSLSSSSTVLSDYKPVQTINWGIFNIGTMPKLNISVVEGYDSDCKWYVDATAQTPNSVDLRSNHAANGMILKRIRMGIITDPNNVASPISYSDNSPSFHETRRLQYGEIASTVFGDKELAVALTYEIINPTRYLDKQITIYKAYRMDYNDLGKVRIDYCSDPGPGIEW